MNNYVLFKLKKEICLVVLRWRKGYFNSCRGPAIDDFRKLKLQDKQVLNMCKQ